MAITSTEKELAAVGISVASGCKPCTNYHVKAAREADASDEDIKQAMIDALAIRRIATEIMQHHALSRLGDAEPHDSSEETGDTTRTRELVFIGAAFGVNCVSSLKHHLDASKTVGVTQEEATEVAKLAVFVKQKAASHVERIFEFNED